MQTVEYLSNQGLVPKKTEKKTDAEDDICFFVITQYQNQSQIFDNIDKIRYCNFNNVGKIVYTNLFANSHVTKSHQKDIII